MSTYAAIDVGSNAIRGIIAEVDSKGTFEITKKIRESLRLGEDVFKRGAISSQKMKDAEEIFSKISDQLVKNKVDNVKVLATSAMRDAKNSKELISIIKSKTGLTVEPIDGDTEAKLIHDAVNLELDLKDKLAVLVDIGGGSTEITISKNKKLVHCRSFNMGAVRLLEHTDLFSLSEVICLQMVEMKDYLDQYIKNQKIDLMVGTGGNFRRLGKIKKKMTERDSAEYAKLEDVHQIFNTLIGMTIKERAKRFEMSDDRADVILPATFMIGHLIKILKIDGVYIPNVGLKEGILMSMIH